MSISERQKKSGTPFPTKSLIHNADRVRFPQIESRIDFSYHPSIQVEWTHISLHDVTIRGSEIEFFLEHPDELTRQLKQAGELIETHGKTGGMNMWRNCNTNTFHVFQGLHYPLTNGIWEHENRDNTHITICEVDPLNNWKDVAISYYIRMDVHENAIWNVKSNIESLISQQVQRGVSQGVAKAIQESTANLAQVANEKKRIDDQIAELQRERQRIEAIETRLQEREAAKQARKQQPKSRAGYVYLIRSLTALHYYKIGRSATPEKRMKRFEVKLPFEVETICLIRTDDMYTLESELHQRFADRRIDGEWFNLDQPDIEYIKSLQGD